MARPMLLSRSELGAVAPLALAVGLRMLGIFLLLPVLAIYVLAMPGGSPPLAGLAVGIYGLAQAAMLLPLGWLSDRIGRKSVLIAGFLLFACGGVVAALATSPGLVIAGRAIQGLGAVSAVAIAAIGDTTRPETRPQAMALIGMAIAMSFGLAIVTATPLADVWGVPALFGITAALGAIAAAAMALAPLAKPAARQAGPASPQAMPTARLAVVCSGVFVIHFAMAAFFVLVPPSILTTAGSGGAAGIIYLGSFLASVALAAPALIWRPAGAGAVAAILIAGTLALVPLAGSLAQLGLLLALFFAGFNYLEATFPAKVTDLAPTGKVGAVSGGYAICQALGVFCGAAVSGQLAQDYNYLGGYLAASLITFWLLSHFLLTRTQR